LDCLAELDDTTGKGVCPYLKAKLRWKIAEEFEF
jgi:hypothetical protein